MEFVREVTERLLELVVAFILVLAGIVATASADGSALWAAFGSGLTALGGVQIAWIASAASGRLVERREQKRQLDVLSRAIGQTVGSVGWAVAQAKEGQMSPERALDLVSQGTQFLYGQVNEISVLRGEAYDSAYLLETAKTLESLARDLEGAEVRRVDARSADEVTRVLEQLGKVRSQLSSRASVERTRSLEEVSCPYCGHQNDVTLGLFPGETTQASCSSCSQTFNAHRDSGGRTFVRRLGVHSPQQRIAIECPSCGEQMSLPRVSTAAKRKVICVSCFVIHQFADDGVELQTVGKAGRSKAASFSRNGKRPRVVCAAGGEELDALLKSATAFLAVCFLHDQVMEISREDFERSGDPDRDASEDE